MKAIAQDRYGSVDVLELKNIEKPVVGDKGVLVRVRAASANPLDWHFMRGRPLVMRMVSGLRRPKPDVRGRDVAGQVEAVGKDVVQLKPGDEVFGCCDGAFAEYLCIRHHVCHRLPDQVSFKAAAMGEPLAVAVHAVIERSRVHSGDLVVVSGPGCVGLLTSVIARLEGGTVVVSGKARDSSRLQCASHYGADLVVDISQQDLKDVVDDVSRGVGADIVFECAGSAPAALQMCDLVRPRGKIIMVSVHKEPHPVDLRSLNFKEVTMIGTRVYTRDDYQKALALIREIPVLDLISHHVDLSQGPKGFDLINQLDDVCKVIIKME